MPTRLVAGTNLVFCINHSNHVSQASLPEGQSTMQEVGTSAGRGWFALTEVRPKADANSKPSFLPSSGIPVKVFTCSLCGYCEIYQGQIIDRNTWS